MVKMKKRAKSSRMHGRKMGTHGGGARKKRKGHGHRGGTGMSGTGKRADHKKTLVLKLYGNKYFGKQGITSRGTKRDKRDRINVGEIQDKYKPGEIDLSKHKVLSHGEIKDKFVIKAKEASKKAIEKVKAAGGEIVLPTKSEPLKKVSKEDQASKTDKKPEKPKEYSGKEPEVKKQVK